MKKKKPFLKLKYPKFFLLLLIFVLAYILFNGRNFEPVHSVFSSLGYFGSFLAGVLFVYGFTAAPATVILLILAKEQNILLAGFIAGLGALVGDLIIFNFIRSSFSDEIEKASKEKMFKYFNKKTPIVIKKYLLPVFAGFLIASPLPDEIGVSLIATSRAISTKLFSVLAYTLNTAGIFIILIIGSLT